MTGNPDNQAKRRSRRRDRLVAIRGRHRGLAVVRVTFTRGHKPNPLDDLFCEDNDRVQVDFDEANETTSADNRPRPNRR